MPLADLRRRANSPGTMPVYGGMMDATRQAGIAGGLQQRGMGAAYDSLGMARQQAMGQGPSLAQAQLGQAQQANLVSQMGMAAQARGTGLASQQRQVGAMGAATGMATARDAAQLRMQEMQQARDAYAQQAQGLAGMGLSANQAAQAQLQNAYGTVYGGQMDWALQQRAMDMQALQNRRQFGMQIASGIAGGMGETAQTAITQGGLGKMGAAIFSDERVKHIESGDKGAEAVAAVKGLRSVKYRYRSEEHGPTDRDIHGFRAQDLERSPAGAQLVTDTPRGKMVDVGGLASLTASAVASLAREVDGLKRGLASARRAA